MPFFMSLQVLLQFEANVLALRIRAAELGFNCGAWIGSHTIM